MNIRIAVVTFLCSTLFLASGCTHQSKAPRTLLTKNEVIVIAKETAKSEGLDVGRYNMTGCHYEYTRKDGTWTVFFNLKPPTPPGGHFSVWVNDKTKEAKLLHGM
jgi:hypothetical protein